MPLDLSTLAERRERIANDFELRIRDPETGETIDAHTPGTGWSELAIAVAGESHGLALNQQWIADQIFISKCDQATLVQRASERGLTPIDASFSLGNLQVRGSVGTVVVAGTVYQTASGVKIRTMSDVTLVSTTANVIAQALMPGVAGNIGAGTRVDLVTSAPGVDSWATVAVPLTGGAEAESIERLRERVLDDVRQAPMGGCSYDYQKWARQAHVDVTRAFVSAHDPAFGIGSVVVRIVCEDLPNPIPGAGLLVTVSNLMETVRPAGLRQFALGAPTPAPMNLVFTSLSPNTTEVRAAIEAEVKDLIRREYTAGGTLLLTHVREAISRATGENDFAITLTTNLTYTAAQYPTWGVPTWPA